MKIVMTSNEQTFFSPNIFGNVDIEEVSELEKEGKEHPRRTWRAVENSKTFETSLSGAGMSGTTSRQYYPQS